MQLTEKAKAISEEIKNTSKLIARLIPEAFPRKRPRICNRLYAHTHAYRRTRARRVLLARNILMYAPLHCQFQILKILSTPTQKFRSGAKNNNGIAIVGESCEEIITNPNEKN